MVPQKAAGLLLSVFFLQFLATLKCFWGVVYCTEFTNPDHHLPFVQTSLDSEALIICSET